MIMILQEFVPDTNYGTYIVQTLISLGATVAGVKVAVNGLKERIGRLENKLDALIEIDSDHKSRISVLEDRQHLQAALMHVKKDS